ncbi:LOW QUALITY PROTEIN: beta-1,3-galactosyltransferase 5-like [Lepeophtheirus salmonis]|uniref:LOW QUALITY PROTEIN: beta-1,3-galactosyltransferase 5-like n=1 Tax=Lepeophtheirus salmonis TaxID=72036 RepID=UPI001AE4C278|nr:LOW QUALITY PROTEIN: beta-1,3-galactosyltransferase 5-like [Lepeophtheirus salmonis]
MFHIFETTLRCFNRGSYRKRRLIFTNKYIAGRGRKSYCFFTVLVGCIFWILFINKKYLMKNFLEDDWWSGSPIWDEDKKPHLNPHVFQFLLDSPTICSKNENVDLLVMVSSAYHHLDRRDAIRNSWGSKKWREPRNIKVVFLLGHVTNKQSDIYVENNKNNDIIQEDFKDTYYNLTLKTVMGLKWTSIYCPQAKFVLKTDDDMFISIPTLHTALQKDLHFDKHIVGCIKNNPETAPQPIPSSSKFQSLPHAHPLFVAGAGYMLPGQGLIRDLYYASLRTGFFAIEDVFTTAHVASRIGLHPPVHDSRFSCGEMSPINYEKLDFVQNCKRLKYKFTEHKVKPEDMNSLYSILNSNDCMDMEVR